MAGSLDELLPPSDQARVVAAIARAERETSGQIKVHLDARWRGDPARRAKALFRRLGLSRTRERNGVLVYVAVGDRKFALLGDAGIHAAVGSPFWDEAAARMKKAFSRGALGDGLVAAIEAIGEELRARFPHRPGASNEISDDISHD